MILLFYLSLGILLYQTRGYYDGAGGAAIAWNAGAHLMPTRPAWWTVTLGLSAAVLGFAWA